MKVNIIADGASDITDEEAEKLGVIKIITPVSFKDGENADGEDFYRALREGKVATTSQITPDEFYRVFSRVREAGESAVCITISSEMSSTYKNAAFIKEREGFCEIYAVDSRMASVAEGFLVREACSLRNKGLSAGEIAAELEKFKKRVKLFACMDTLKYVARSGRISPSAAAIGAILNIKPIITFSAEGRVSVASRPHGKRRGAAKIAELIKAGNAEPSYLPAAIYSDDEKNCDDLLLRLSGEGIRVDKKIKIGRAIGAHIGPEAFGIVFVTK